MGWGTWSWSSKLLAQRLVKLAWPPAARRLNKDLATLLSKTILQWPKLGNLIPRLPAVYLSQAGCLHLPLQCAEFMQ